MCLCPRVWWWSASVAPRLLTGQPAVSSVAVVGQLQSVLPGLHLHLVHVDIYIRPFFVVSECPKELLCPTRPSFYFSSNSYLSPRLSNKESLQGIPINKIFVLVYLMKKHFSHVELLNGLLFLLVFCFSQSD